MARKITRLETQYLMAIAVGDVGAAGDCIRQNVDQNAGLSTDERREILHIMREQFDLCGIKARLLIDRAQYSVRLGPRKV